MPLRKKIDLCFYRCEGELVNSLKINYFSDITVSLKVYYCKQYNNKSLLLQIYINNKNETKNVLSSRNILMDLLIINVYEFCVVLVKMHDSMYIVDP